MSGLEPKPAAKRPIIVAIGASNLSRGLPRLVAAARARGGPADVLAAAGHGRSFGANSRVAWRRLPSILKSGLWQALQRIEPSESARPVCAVVTDIGNDLLYGFSVQQTAGWVRECVARLAARGTRVAITGLPLTSVARAGPLRYRLLKTVYVPGCPLSLEDLRTAASRLDEAVRGIAAAHGATLIEQPGEWYGFDSIHLRRRRLDSLWGVVSRVWELPDPGIQPRASLVEWGAGGAAVGRGSVAGRQRAVHPAARGPLARRRDARALLRLQHGQGGEWRAGGVGGGKVTHQPPADRFQVGPRGGSS